ncbi:hypothetical protein E2562_018809 [Oryza meyeriana var. granulata]|uniref:DUF834 domain-containing protein n=1 Tax=Oryza meyeriana var. granulata TaxID=110450 RepID=A0A6G1F9R7_9ORYZ|nr:hypothetical protein E2562_018809 [Oryza meyeriana var. granulata]
MPRQHATGESRDAELEGAWSRRTGHRRGRRKPSSGHGGGGVAAAAADLGGGGHVERRLLECDGPEMSI